MAKPHGGGKTIDPFGLADRFFVVYAGNLGHVQGLDAVIEAASLLHTEYRDVLFVFVGDGIAAAQLKEIATGKGLNNVFFIPRQPVSEIGAILERADALLITLRDDSLCRIGIPQKTQAYLAAGRPIIVAVKGDAADLVSGAKAGIPCEPEHPESIAEAVKKMHDLPSQVREDMGRSGLAYYQRNLAFKVGAQCMSSILTEIAQ